MKFALLITFLLQTACASAQYLQHPSSSSMPLKEHDRLLQLAPYANTANKTTAAVFDTTSWASTIDANWGSGLSNVGKLELFDKYWNHIDSAYACFVQLPLYNWDSLINEMRTEISAGVSRGRFAGIIGNLLTYINDGHSSFYDISVNYTTPIAPGLPVFRGQSGRFGACITALDDSSALVYEAEPNHPLGLQPGDIILGYNGIPWKDLVGTILRHQLPNSVYKGSTDVATWRRYIKAVGENWYMFDTINIQKCDGSIENHPVSAMTGTTYFKFCSDQMPVAGVPKLSYSDIYQQNLSYSSGVVAGTDIGYVYMYDCSDMSGDSLYNRVKTLVEDSAVNGLIIDIRTNFGGSLMAFKQTFEYLHTGFVSWLGYGERSDPADRYAMTNTGSPAMYNVTDSDPKFFTGPIALLTGSEAVSAGDLLPLMFQHHPTLRSFGKSTAGAYGAVAQIPLGNSSYGAATQVANFFRVEDPNYYLTHTEFPVDQDTWFKRSSVCAGEDNVVTEAINWINNVVGVPVTEQEIYDLAIFPNPANSVVNVKINSRKIASATIAITTLTGVQAYKKQIAINIGENIEQLDTNGLLPTGTYLVSVQMDGAAISHQKLVVR